MEKTQFKTKLTFKRKTLTEALVEALVIAKCEKRNVVPPGRLTGIQCYKHVYLPIWPEVQRMREEELYPVLGGKQS